MNSTLSQQVSNLQEEAELLKANYLLDTAVALFKRCHREDDSSENHGAIEFSKSFSMAALHCYDTLQSQLTTAQSLVLDEAFVCRACGLFLVPGIHGTTVRVRSVGRGRTRRRRDLRKRYKEHVQKQLPAQSQPDPESIRRIANGSCINSVIYTCGSCGNKARFQGITAVAKAKLNRALRDNSLKVKEEAPKIPPTNPQPKLQSTPKVGHSFSKKSALATYGGITKVEHTKLPQSKGKKKSGNKSGLLDFLSSLQD